MVEAWFIHYITLTCITIEVNAFERQLSPQAIWSRILSRTYILISMKSKKLPKVTPKDKAWQEKIEKKVVAEGIQLVQPQGKKRFDSVLFNAFKSRSNK